MPDTPGKKGHIGRSFYIEPKSTADMTGLNTLPEAKVKAACERARHGQESRITVTIENPGQSIAFFLRLAVTKGENGEEIGPVYWNENCFSLLPGMKRTITAAFPTAELDGEQAAVLLEGYNVKSAYLP